MSDKPDWNRLADAILGTQGSISERLLEELDLLDYEEDDIDEEMLNLGIERCSNCGLWVESGEVIDDDGEIVSCGAC